MKKIHILNEVQAQLLAARRGTTKTIIGIVQRGPDNFRDEAPSARAAERAKRRRRAL